MSASLTTMVLPSRRKSLKNTSVWSAGQQKRREQVLKRQNEARRNLANYARSIAKADEDDVKGDDSYIRNDATPVTKELNFKEINLIRKREYWNKQLSTPEWMLEVPPALDVDWLVMPRPEGKRVIVIATNCQTKGRAMNGSILYCWKSVLPGGGLTTKSSGSTILDCIFHELDRTFYVLDMLSWNDFSLYDCTSDFRQYWIRTKLEEVNASYVCAQNEYSIQPLPYFECNEKGLIEAYSGTMSFIRDGLLFLYKAAHYSLGVTPLCLLWKDENTTRYLTVGKRQSIVLEAHTNMHTDGLFSFSTSDDPPVILHCCQATANLKNLKDGDIVRFSIESAQLTEGEDGSGIPLVTGTVFEKSCSRVRPAPDSFSKILFQSGIRTGDSRIYFEDILSQIHTNAMIHDD